MTAACRDRWCADFAPARPRRAAVFALVAALLPRIGCAGPVADSPAGLWTTIDDTTHEARAVVEIRDTDGTLTGRIVRLFRKPGEEASPACVKCPGERRGQPIVGMTILWNLRRHGSEWSGGEILDPETGHAYRASVHPVDEGRRLEVRGYIGVPLLGRTQSWLRVAGK